MLLTVRHLAKHYGNRPVLDDGTFAIGPQERAGLVGLNGVGKSTLLRMLAGEEVPDAGTVQYAPGSIVGYLPQTWAVTPAGTIAELLAAAVGHLHALEARLAELEAQLASCCGDAIEPLMADYGEVQAEFQARGGYDLAQRIDGVLRGLGLSHLDRDRTISTLSGGERSRIGLAALLLKSPDILLLDEPTNHLDSAALAWLEGYLAEFAGGVLVVAHDRQFLNRVVNRIWELDDRTHRLTAYSGDYEAFVVAKQRERDQALAAYEAQQEEIAELRRRVRTADQHVGHKRPPRDNDVAQYKGRGEWVQQAAAGAIRSAQEQLDRLTRDPLPKPPKSLRFRPRLDHEVLRADAIIRASSLGAERGGRWLFRDLDLVISAGAHIILTGPNGAGKTTLLRLLLGLDAPNTGTVQIAGRARVGYLAQSDALADFSATVLDSFMRDHPMPTDQATNALIGSGLFHLEDLPKRLAMLSQGQRQKIAIAGIIADRPNILALDEPTNYLSLDVLEAFERAVLAFDGPVLAISHDRWFIQRFGGTVWRLEAGVLNRQNA